MLLCLSQAQQAAESETEQRAAEGTQRVADLERQLSRLQAQVEAAERQLREPTLLKHPAAPGTTRVRQAPDPVQDRLLHVYCTTR